MAEKTSRTDGVLAGNDATDNSSGSQINHAQNEKSTGPRTPTGPTKPTGILGMFSRLGDLPEWKVRGKHLQGATLNYSIGFIASCGFLMFGYDQGVLSALLTTVNGNSSDIPNFESKVARVTL